METPSTATPSPESRTEVTHSSSEVFSQSAIEAVRATQKETYYLVFEQAIAEGKNISEAKRVAETASILSGHDYLDQYAEEPWLKDDIDEGYQIIDKYSFGQMSDTEWISAERDDKGRVITPSGINQLQEDMRVFDASDTTPPAAEADPRQEALKDELNDLRDKLTTLSAKRQGSLVDFNKERYDEALAAYNAKFIELARLELSEKLAVDDITPAERNALVVERFFNEQQELRKESREKMKHTHVGKFVEWFTSGSRSQRFLRAGLVGAGAATVGVIAGGVVGGVVGTAAVATGAAAAVTGITRFAKAYAKRDNNEGRGLDAVAVEHKSKAERSAQFNPDTDVFESIQNYFGRELEGDTKKEKLKRLRSVAFGLGAVAVGGAAATAISFAAETGIVQHAYESTKDFFTNLGVDAQPSVDTPTTYADDLREPLDFNANQIPETHGDASVLEAPISDPKFTVGEGQGGIQFFQEKLGLSESQWDEIASDLRKNFPDEFYDYGTEVRIQNSGGLSIPAQQFIKNRFGL